MINAMKCDWCYKNIYKKVDKTKNSSSFDFDLGFDTDTVDYTSLILCDDCRKIADELDKKGTAKCRECDKTKSSDELTLGLCEICYSTKLNNEVTKLESIIYGLGDSSTWQKLIPDEEYQRWLTSGQGNIDYNWILVNKDKWVKYKLQSDGWSVDEIQENYPAVLSLISKTTILQIFKDVYVFKVRERSKGGNNLLKYEAGNVVLMEPMKLN